MAMKEKPTYTIIGTNTIIDGLVHVNGDIIIGGTVKNNVDAKGTVRIPEGGLVDGSVKAREVHLNGQVTKGIYADEKIVLGINSDFSGELVTKKLVVEEGARISGKIQVSEKKKDTKITESE
ncbi:MAG: polymer-forming cytoskeletal protein [Candidatus Neomarinimicrobiota bacterium]|jgi:cytoskeletal protein CcmA (bactofilin family)|nr:polymer-forming cytoskeletal protein [bacterium]